MTNPVSGSGARSLPLNKSVISKTTDASSGKPTSNVQSDISSPVSPATTPSATENATVPAASTPAATIDLSSRGQAAVALLRGADQVARGYSSAALDALATQISQGIYKPPPESVAKALISYELRFLKGA